MSRDQIQSGQIMHPHNSTLKLIFSLSSSGNMFSGNENAVEQKQICTIKKHTNTNTNTNLWICFQGMKKQWSRNARCGFKAVGELCLASQKYSNEIHLRRWLQLQQDRCEGTFIIKLSLYFRENKDLKRREEGFRIQRAEFREVIRINIFHVICRENWMEIWI